ncbi:2-oxoacid:acceptor oxidoreductase family protein [Candidatus Peregrinibacteria bacterium]|nr:2-oxoacid:acceptor oxidoreductase family protein [Candidatus Peregrinibacteria bacterium]
MSRVALKIVGAQGQGVNSIGEICAKGLKRAGYCVFGYREYMSLIKGGHSCYQLDISDCRIGSSETKVNILVALNHHGLNKNAGEVKDSGIIIHQTPQWEFPSDADADLRKRNVTVLYLPAEDILKKIKGKAILGNMLTVSAVWSLLGRDADDLKKLVREQFERKGEELVQMNFRCIDEGVTFIHDVVGAGHALPIQPIALPPANSQLKSNMLITGSQAMGLGLIRGGCRFYAGYPMTPASPLLTFIADAQNDTGMVVKQAEDEITAAQMMSGAMYMGTRAATGTSGGGFDLMTETVSLNGIVENPSVFILAQRPGPGTGLPTWTAQGDLLLAIGSAHGEFARCVISVSDAQDCFDLMPEAFNIAEEFQTPVIVMTDKHIAEGLFTQERFDQEKTKIRRGNLITDPKQLKKLKSHDRYDPATTDGISPRWLPGADAATYCAQGDEHDAEGAVNETAKNAAAQMEKRMRKMEALKKMLPEPTLWSVESARLPPACRQGRAGQGKWKVANDDSELDLLVVSWGSNKGAIRDALATFGFQLSVGYLHYTYLWPIKTDRLQSLMKKAKRTVLVECNAQGQLGMVIKMASGIDIKDRILKFDGRPFFCDELSSLLSAAPAIRHP